MASNTKAVPQHKRLAMGDSVGFRRGGIVGAGSKLPKTTNLMTTGIPTTPLTDSKRANGVPGYKKGGKVKDSDGDGYKKGGRMKGAC